MHLSIEVAQSPPSEPINLHPNASSISSARPPEAPKTAIKGSASFHWQLDRDPIWDTNHTTPSWALNMIVKKSLRKDSSRWKLSAALSAFQTPASPSLFQISASHLPRRNYKHRPKPVTKDHGPASPVPNLNQDHTLDSAAAEVHSNRPRHAREMHLITSWLCGRTLR